MAGLIYKRTDGNGLEKCYYVQSVMLHMKILIPKQEIPFVAWYKESYRQVQYMETYQVCERIENEPGAIYVDLRDGWQARLDRGEYEIVK